LEQRNVRAESERECDPLRDIIQFPVRFRSAAAKCQCHSRLFQDRIAHDGWDPGTRRGRHPNPNAYSYCYGDRYSYSDSYGYGYGHCDDDSYTDSYSTAYIYAKR
jgi:hypothetical protein